MLSSAAYSPLPACSIPQVDYNTPTKGLATTWSAEYPSEVWHSMRGCLGDPREVDNEARTPCSGNVRPLANKECC